MLRLNTKKFTKKSLSYTSSSSPNGLNYFRNRPTSFVHTVDDIFNNKLVLRKFLNNNNIKYNLKNIFIITDLENVAEYAYETSSYLY